MLAYQRFLEHVPAGAHLLDAGCGAGEDLHYFREQGFVVTAFDASLTQASAASRLTGQPVRVCRFDEMHSVVPYDGIWASASLPCLSEPQLGPNLTHLVGLLRPKAPLYCSFPYGIGEESPEFATPQGEYPLRTGLDEIRLQQLVAPLPLSLHALWCSDRTDTAATGNRWLHALLIRTA